MVGKTFPNRTEGSVKKHWYKVRKVAGCLGPLDSLTAAQDMHYADFAEDEVSHCQSQGDEMVKIGLTVCRQSAALFAAIKEYEASKWKVIGQKVGKPAKVSRSVACADPHADLSRHASSTPKNIFVVRFDLLLFQKGTLCLLTYNFFVNVYAAMLPFRKQFVDRMSFGVCIISSGRS